MNLAVRTVSETDDVHVIEGLAYPFRGRDTYGTFFSARTDFHWDLFPDAIPLRDGTRTGEGDVVGEARFIRPATFHHGFEPDFGLARIGGWSPVRSDADGIWVQAQIDKRSAYYATRIKPLLDAGALGLSGGSAEHSVRIDQRSGEVLEWPAYELALTPVESNPLAAIAARAGETLRIVELLADHAPDEPPVDRTPAAAVRAIQTFNDIVAGAELSEELPEAFDTLTSAIWSAIYATDADWNPLPIEDKRTAIQTSLDQFRDYVLGLIDTSTPETTARAFLAAIRAGRRNSADDSVALSTAHNSIASVLDLDCAPGDASARSGEDLPAFRLTADPERPDLELAAMATRAAQTAADEAVRRLTG